MSASSLALLALVFFIGFVSGTVTMWFAARRSGGGKGAAELRRELETYRSEVAQHYAETARRIDTLTRSYKEVYDHLEQGAYSLVGEEELRKRLAGNEPSAVTLEGIGASRRVIASSAPKEVGTDIRQSNRERPDDGESHPREGSGASVITTPTEDPGVGPARSNQPDLEHADVDSPSRAASTEDGAEAGRPDAETTRTPAKQEESADKEADHSKRVPDHDA